MPVGINAFFNMCRGAVWIAKRAKYDPPTMLRETFNEGRDRSSPAKRVKYNTPAVRLEMY